MDYKETITIYEYLDSYKKGNSIARADVLTVYLYWIRGSWRSIHSIALAKICHDLKVSKLIFVKRIVERDFQITDDEFFNLMAKISNLQDYPFLNNLKRIEVDYMGKSPQCWDIVKRSNVRSFTWNLSNRLIEITHERILDYADQALDSMQFDYGMEKQFHLRELKFRVPWLECPINYDPVNGPFNITGTGTLVLEYLERNQLGFKKCVDIIVVLLGLKKRTTFWKNRDVVGLIISNVWSTRYKMIWYK
jgi:hypothetical protein